MHKKHPHDHNYPRANEHECARNIAFYKTRDRIQTYEHTIRTHVYGHMYDMICTSDQGYVGGRKHGWRQRTFFDGVHGLGRPQRQFCMLAEVVETALELAQSLFCKRHCVAK